MLKRHRGIQGRPFTAALLGEGLWDWCCEFRRSVPTSSPHQFVLVKAKQSAAELVLFAASALLCDAAAGQSNCDTLARRMLDRGRARVWRPPDTGSRQRRSQCIPRRCARARRVGRRWAKTWPVQVAGRGRGCERLDQGRVQGNLDCMLLVVVRWRVHASDGGLQKAAAGQCACRAAGRGDIRELRKRNRKRSSAASLPQRL